MKKGLSRLVKQLFTVNFVATNKFQKALKLFSVYTDRVWQLHLLKNNNATQMQRFEVQFYCDVFIAKEINLCNFLFILVRML